MATIKSHTDLPQSKVLAKILPLESADMYYSHEFVNSAGDYYKLNIASEGYFDDEEILGSDIPCWSLAALLEQFPSGVKEMKRAKEEALKAYPPRSIAANYDTIARRDAFEYGYLKAEKDNELSWEDMRELHIIFAEIDVDIELCKTDIKTETLGYYQEVLKRFKKLKK